MFQLPTWELYRDYELTHEGLEQYPGGPMIPRIDDPGITYEMLEQKEEDDPDDFRVEYRAQWRDSVMSYLRPDVVDAAFGIWKGQPLANQAEGVSCYIYVGHVDLSKSGANTAVVIAHLEQVDGVYHVVVDLIHVFDPKTFPDGIIDYDDVLDELKDLLRFFSMSQLTFDQYQSIMPIAELQKYVRTARLPRQTNIFERTATASMNWRQAEFSHKLFLQGRVHLPEHDLARRELLALEEGNRTVKAPKVGPTRTDDICDALFNVIWSLLAEPDVGAELSAVNLRASFPGGLAEQFSAAGRRGRGFGHGEVRGGGRGAARGGRFR